MNNNITVYVARILQSLRAAMRRGNPKKFFQQVEYMLLWHSLWKM